MIKIINDNGMIWAVEITENVIGKKLITFYDTRHEFTPLGQPVSTYLVETIVSGDSGLNLYGGVAEWVVSADAMNRIRDWLKTI